MRRVSKTATRRVGKDVIATASAASGGEVLPDPTFEAVAVPDARRLYSLALSILRDQGEAEDAVQETLLKAWRSWNSVSHMERPTAWLTRVCVNHCISRRRHLRSRGWPPLDLFDGATGGTFGGPDRRPHRHGSSLPAALAQAARGHHPQLPARLLHRGVRRIHGVPARDRPHACRTWSQHVAKGARRCLTSNPDWSPDCSPSTRTSKGRRLHVASRRSRGLFVTRAAGLSIWSWLLRESPWWPQDVSVFGAELAGHHGARPPAPAGRTLRPLSFAATRGADHCRPAIGRPHGDSLQARHRVSLAAGIHARRDATLFLCREGRSRVHPTNDLFHLHRVFLRRERLDERALDENLAGSSVPACSRNGGVVYGATVPLSYTPAIDGKPLSLEIIAGPSVAWEVAVADSGPVVPLRALTAATRPAGAHVIVAMTYGVGTGARPCHRPPAVLITSSTRARARGQSIFRAPTARRTG